MQSILFYIIKIFIKNELFDYYFDIIIFYKIE